MHQKLFELANTKIYQIVRGQVVNNNDPNQRGACQVRWMPYFQGLNVIDIPWSIPAMPLFDGAGNGSGSFTVPSNKTFLWGWFENGDVYQGVFFAEATDYVHGIPSDALISYPNSKVYQTANGIEVNINDTTQTIGVSANEIKTSGNLSVGTGATGTFISLDGQIITVSNGIVISII